MILVLSNGQTRVVEREDVVIVPIPGRVFDIEKMDTWESDRAWAFATVGRKIWTEVGNEIAEIVQILPWGVHS
jgi:hypothetical protein